MAPISLSTLVISTTGSNDYMCVADNNVGDAVSLNFSLVKTGHCNCIRTFKGSKCLVEGQSTEVLVFITKPLDHTAMDGNLVEFQCSACSTLEPTITWAFIRKGSMQSEVINENSTFVDIVPGENSLSLIINSVNWTYEGIYKCTISTENNQIEAEASLNVLIPTSAAEISGNTATPDEQQTLIIECRVIANPPAIFEWSRDGEILNDSRISIAYEFKATDEPTSTSILTIRNVTADDGENYICTAENSLSFRPVSANFTVTVTELPPAPVDVLTICDLIVWRNAPNISFDDIAGYEVRLVNSATNKEVIKHLDGSATFYNLDELEDETLKHESTFIQVRVVSHKHLGLFSSLKSLGCHVPVSEPPPPPVNIQTSCDLVTWHNAPNISYDDITGYEIRLLNQATDEEVVDYLDASATFYSLDNLNEMLKSESTSVQVRVLSNKHLGQFSPQQPLDCHQSVSGPIPPPVDIQTSCDLVVWRNAPNISYGDITGYDIRLINSAKNKELVKHLNASATFYSLGELNNALKSELAYVQVSVKSREHLGQLSQLRLLECHQPVSPPVLVNNSSGVYIHMQGKNYTNNSVMNIADIGLGDDALLCITDKECCCGVRGYRYGQFYYPDGSQVPPKAGGNVLYRDRREKMIRLNRSLDCTLLENIAVKYQMPEV